MTTVDDFGQYTGVNGALTIDGVAFADVQFDIRWATGDVNYPRSNKRSDGCIPGKRTVTCKIRKVFQHEDASIVLGYGITDTPTTGSAGALLAATTITADTMAAITSNPATPSRVTITLSVDAITTAGKIVVYGTDVNDVPITEIFAVPLNAPSGTVYTGSKVFKTTTHLAFVDVASTGGAKAAVAGIAGDATMKFGDPKIFDIVGTLTKGAKTITITLTDCWLKNGGITWTDAGKVIEVDADVSMHDPDTMTVVVVG